MISILYDDKSISWPLITLLKKLPIDDIMIVNIPSADFTLRSGIHISLGFTRLVKRLARKKIRSAGHFSNILRELDILDRDIPDIDLALCIAQTLWMKNDLRLLEFYKRISLILNIKYKLYPLLDPPPSMSIKTSLGELDPISFRKLRKVPDIKSIDFVNLDKSNIIKETKEALRHSSKVLLFQTTPLSMYLLKSIGGLNKMLEEFKGSIIYLLPRRLSSSDKAILKKLGYAEDMEGLIDFSCERVDAIIFDDKHTNIVENSSKYNVTLYPMSYNTNDKETLKRFIDDLLTILYK